MILRRTAVGAALIAASLALAAPAMADQTDPTSSVGCSPCARGATSSATTPTPIWNQIWPGGDAKGPWENAFAADIWGNGVQAINGGAWEKVFGEAP
ncbi:hypothetical protein [Mycobacterium dioxanotrophicus]|uniref:hypothetical protein n=1 Tax=Mycobacterium dioxanotrophicus TaxID=482462 RepID=UPI0012F717E0|nr:hypothetical protein [Mycobacterium dioxanotrophicus]